MEQHDVITLLPVHREIKGRHTFPFPLLGKRGKTSDLMRLFLNGQKESGEATQNFSWVQKKE